MSEAEFDRGVNAEIARLARDLHSHQPGGDGIEDMLLEVTVGSVKMLPHVEHAGISLIDARRRHLQSLAATGEVPRESDRLQQIHQQGPCLESIWQHHTVRVDDYTSETRWPDFVAALLESTSIKSSLTIQLYTNESELGALNLYSEKADTFTPHIEELALVLAAHAAIGLSTVRRGEQFESALASRDIIGQAKGIVMERYDVNALTAFGLLAKLSQRRNMPLREIAQRLVSKEHPSG